MERRAFVRFDFRGLYKRAALIFAIVYTVLFAIYYCGTLMAFDGKLYPAFDAVISVYGFLNTALGFILLALSALLLMPKLEDRGFIGALPVALLISLPSLCRNIPYNYLYYISYGYDSVEALLLALLYSALIIALSALFTLGLSALALRALHKRGGDCIDFCTRTNPFAPKTPSGASVFIICSVCFALTLLLEIYDTAYYLIEYSGRYALDEIIYITLRFIFIIFVYVFALWFIDFIKNKILAKRFVEVYDREN